MRVNSLSVLFFILLPALSSGHGRYMLGRHCSTPMIEGEEIMGFRVFTSSKHACVVSRGGVDLKPGELYQPGEILKVGFTGKWGEWVVEEKAQRLPMASAPSRIGRLVDTRISTWRCQSGWRRQGFGRLRSTVRPDICHRARHPQSYYSRSAARAGSSRTSRSTLGTVTVTSHRTRDRIASALASVPGAGHHHLLLCTGPWTDPSAICGAFPSVWHQADTTAHNSHALHHELTQCFLPGHRHPHKKQHSVSSTA